MLGAFTQHYDTEVLDSSLLMMPLQGFIAPRHPMWLSTLAAMDREVASRSTSTISSTTALVFSSRPHRSVTDLSAGDIGGRFPRVLTRRE